MRTRIDRGRQRGQALAELALCILLFTILTLGIVDFGRMLMVLNVITHAARDGARIAALTNDDLWSGTGLGGAAATTVQTRVRDQIATVLPRGEADAFGVNISRTNSGSPSGEEAQVQVTGSVNYIFRFPGLWGGSVVVNRVATYRFEG